MKARISSLGVRLLVPLSLIIGGVLAAHALISFRTTRERFLQLVSDEADRSSGLIRRATHDGMLLNRLDEVQSMIERLSAGSEVAAIRVYDRVGRVVLSSDRSEIGQRLSLAAPKCGSCHSGGSGGQVRTQARERSRSGSEEVLRQLSVIESEPGCTVAGCHDRDAGKRVLGVLEVEMSMQPLHAALAASQGQLFWTTLVLLLVSGVVTWITFRRLIYRPIRVLQAGARRIAGGDLSTRLEVPGGHELAFLARDFNRMAEDLSRMQEEVRDWSQTLEQKVVEKAAELQSAQRQVLHMEKMASLGKLSATVAHEINNPLSGVLTYARLVERVLAEQPLEASVAEELQRYLQLVQRECSRCGAIVQNLLAFARRTGGELVTVDVDDVVERSIMLLRHHLEISGISLRTQLLKTEREVVADPGQLEQALVALLVNAIEAMPSGGELGVRLSGDAAAVQIEISDTGIGIPADVLPQVFEPFFSTKHEQSGAGLGLAVVYGIVNRHGATIRIDSEPDQGTTVRVRLPRHPPEESPAEAGALDPPGTVS